MELVTQIFGWIGAFLVVFAYFLVSSRKVDGSNKIYQLMNFLGAVGAGINAFTNKRGRLLLYRLSGVSSHYLR